MTYAPLNTLIRVFIHHLPYIMGSRVPLSDPLISIQGPRTRHLFVDPS